MQKGNYIYRITYILLILLLLIGTIFYRQSFLAILVLLLIILPILSITLTYFVFQQVELSLSSPVPMINLPEQALVLLTVRNASYFPFFNCEITFHYQNTYFPNQAVHNIALPIETHKSNTFRFPFEIENPGLFLFSLESIKLTDYLHFYTFSKSLNKMIQIPVLPKEISIAFEPAVTHTESEDSDLYDPAGMLSTDIREVREYLPGDRLQDMHWKLSARMDDLLVKQYERSLNDSLLFLPELYKNELSDTLHTLYAVGLNLIRKREVFRIALFHTDSMEIEQSVVHDTEDLIQAFLTLYYQATYDTPALASSTYQTIFPYRGAYYHIHGTVIELKEG